MSNFQFSPGGDISVNHQKVGFIQGDQIYTRDNRKVGFIQGDQIYTADNRKVGYVQGNMIFTADGRQAGPAIYPHPRWNAAAYFLLT